MTSERHWMVFLIGWYLFAALNGRGSDWPEFAPGMAYTNIFLPHGPWSFHIVRLKRAQPDWEFRNLLAQNKEGSLATLRELLAEAEQEGTPLAAINGDFFQLRGPAVGDPRGLMIRAGELVSAPNGGAAFWIDPHGRLCAAYVYSRCTVTWPNGRVMPVGLNEELNRERAVLYTPALGETTPAAYRFLGREIILEHYGQGPWLPLRPGMRYEARVRAVYDTGLTPLEPNSLVLTISSNLIPRLPMVQPGMIIKISTHTVPSLRGVDLAIGGGPVLIQNGWHQTKPRRPKGKNLPYSVTSQWERHPRSALGWNQHFFYLVTVDGRQPQFSIGMKVHELSTFMRQTLDCQEAINLDGGGSATLWCDGQVRNGPADGEERPIANALVVVRPAKTGK